MIYSLKSFYTKTSLISLAAILFVVLTVNISYSDEALQMKPGNIIRIVRVDVDPKMEAEFNNWYNTEHEHLLLRVPGVLWTYKGVNLGEKGPKYFYMYVHEDMNVQKSDQYRKCSQTDWSKAIRPFLTNFQAMNFEVIAPDQIPTQLKQGNIIRTIQLNVSPEKEEEFNTWYDTEHVPLLKKVPGVISVWRAVNLGEKGQKYLTVYFQDDLDVQQKADYKNASQTKWSKALFPYLKDFTGTNYSVQF